jgi:hypothetical protein
MMLNQLLNADMATIGRAIRAGLRWWVDELRTLLPAGIGAAREPALLVDPVGRLAPLGGRAAWDDKMPTRAQIVVPASTALLRAIELPAMSRRDLVAMITLDIERYLPLPAGSALIDAAIVGQAKPGGMIDVEIAALPNTVASEAIERFRTAGILPTQLRLAADGVPDARFDFLPAARAGGLVEPTHGAAAIWWALVGFLFVLNFAILVWRDEANVERMQTMVDAQSPAVQIARRVTRDMHQTDLIAHRAVDRRASHDVLGDLAVVSRAVPDGAWIQHYAWDGTLLRLSGYRAPDSDVAAALRREPRFASVKSAQTEALAEIGSGEPFDLTITEKAH